MNSRLKRFQAIGLALLLALLPCLFTTAQTPVPKVRKVYTDYGLESEMRIPSKIMQRTITKIPRGMRVAQLRTSPLIFNEAGGIMFDAEGQPCEGMANSRLRLSYNRKRPDGKRLALHAGARAYTVEGIRDSDLRPIAEFADDQLNAPVITNLQYPDAPIRESCPLPSDGLRVVTLHPAFLDTHMGWLLTNMDSVPWSLSRGERWNSIEPLPPATLSLAASLARDLRTDEAKYREAWLMARTKLINAGEGILRALSEEDKKHYATFLEARRRRNFDWESYEAEVLADPAIDKAAWEKLSVADRHILLIVLEVTSNDRVSNINDYNAPPSFCTQGSTVKFDGSPRLEFIAPWYTGTRVLQTSSSLMTENMSQLRLVDQEAYDGMMKIYRLGGLFRYVKQQSPFLWKQFLKTLPPKEKKDTYTIVCPDCKKADVEKWLTCVERNFPPAAGAGQR